MLREVLKSKLNKAIITKLKLDYAGSIGIDKTLIEGGDLISGEKVQVLNFNNGQRFETYVIEEEAGSGTIALYGPAARLGEVGDKICVLSYCLVDEQEAAKLKPRILLLDKNNKIKA